MPRMHQNLWWAVGYNGIAFPLGAGVMHPFVLSPEIAAMSMSGSASGSTCIAAINVLMLKRTELAGIRQPGKTEGPAIPSRPAIVERIQASAGPVDPQPNKRAAA